MTATVPFGTPANTMQGRGQRLRPVTVNTSLPQTGGHMLARTRSVSHDPAVSAVASFHPQLGSQTPFSLQTSAGYWTDNEPRHSLPASTTQEVHSVPLHSAQQRHIPPVHRSGVYTAASDSFLAGMLKL